MFDHYFDIIPTLFGIISKGDYFDRRRDDVWNIFPFIYKENPKSEGS